jgi:hypothetical protein
MEEALGAETLPHPGIFLCLARVRLICLPFSILSVQYLTFLNAGPSVMIRVAWECAVRLGEEDPVKLCRTP